MVMLRTHLIGGIIMPSLQLKINCNVDRATHLVPLVSEIVTSQDISYYRNVGC